MTDYRAVVTRCSGEDDQIRAAVTEALHRREVRTLVVPADLQPAWIPHDVEVLRDDPPLGVHELDQAQGVLTGCALAVAETGTLALDAGPGQGRRVITLLPDVHVCVVRTEQVLANVPQALAQLEEAVTGGRRPLTLISGPSATSDIELQRVEGVHGPRHLEVIVAG